MNSKLFKTAFIAIVAMMSITLSSCDPDEPYQTPLLGIWELAYINDRPVADVDIDKFRFNIDGTGTYAYYNNYGRWTQESIRWESMWNTSLTVTFMSDYKSYTMSYRIARDGALEIYDSSLFNGLHVYYPTRN